MIKGGAKNVLILHNFNKKLIFYFFKMKKIFYNMWSYFFNSFGRGFDPHRLQNLKFYQKSKFFIIIFFYLINNFFFIKKNYFFQKKINNLFFFFKKINKLNKNNFSLFKLSFFNRKNLIKDFEILKDDYLFLNENVFLMTGFKNFKKRAILLDFKNYRTTQKW